MREELVCNEHIENSAKISAFYNIAHYYIILKKNLIKQMDENEEVKITECMEMSNTIQEYKNLRNWLGMELENAERQHRIFYCQCI